MVAINETKKPITFEDIPAETEFAEALVRLDRSYKRLREFIQLTVPAVIIDKEVEILRGRLDKLPDQYRNYSKEK